MSMWKSVGNCVYGKNIETHTGIWLPYLPQRLGLEWVRKFFINYILFDL